MLVSKKPLESPKGHGVYGYLKRNLTVKIKFTAISNGFYIVRPPLLLDLICSIYYYNFPALFKVDVG